MRTLLKDDLVVVVPDTGVEREAVEAKLALWGHHAFRACRSGATLLFQRLGPYQEVFNVPVNVTSKAAEPATRLISNFAATPFELHGASYVSVEGFWQSLRATNRVDRDLIARMAGVAAKRAGQEFPTPATVLYGGQLIRWGSPEHWDLMRIACRAKFTQSIEARNALLGTAPRPLQHRMRRDSRSIPGLIMAGIWMHLRDEFLFAEKL